MTATLYAQTAAEHHASTRAIFAAASAQLAAALEDGGWEATIEGGKGDAPRPDATAIILDVDETVLDNSPYQVAAIERNLRHPDGWAEWCNMAVAEPVQGAVEFTNFAASRGVTVFYVTNRDHALEDATRKNLVAAGFPMADGVDVVLTKHERSEWTGDKTTRRRFVAENYRVVMLFGDQLGDFTGQAGAEGEAPAERDALVESHRERWGRQWFVLPNPLYGAWDSVTYGHDHARSEAAKTEGRLRAMHGVPSSPAR